MTIRTRFAAASLAAVVGLFAVSAANAACRLHVMRHMTVTTHEGKQIPLDVIQYNGHMMTLVPEDMTPDYLHQMIFRRQ